MQKRENAKNPGVWRKTGQPSEKASLGKHLMKTDTDAGGINSIDDDDDYNNGGYPASEFDLPSMSNAGSRRASIAKSRNESYVVAGKMSGKDKLLSNTESSYLREGKSQYNADPFGLGFQGKGNTQKTITEAAFESTSFDGSQDGRLPAINENRTREKSRKTSMRKEADKDGELKGADNVETPASFTWNQGLKKTGNNVEDAGNTKFPPVAANDNMMRRPNEQSAVMTLSRKTGSNPDALNRDSSALLPFNIIDKNSYNDSGANRKALDLSYKASTDKITYSNFARTSEDRSNGFERGNNRMRGSKASVRMRNFSICSQMTPKELICHQNLMTEAYSMQTLRFTNNFTFSFFDIPSSYEEQNNEVRCSVNRIGKRKAPKFSKPFKKTIRNQVKVKAQSLDK